MVERVSILGLGKLGASMMAGMASRGLHVIGVDVIPAVVEAVNAGRAPVLEPGLDSLIQANRERIKATLSTDEAVLNSEISFVIVPTPSDERGAFSLQYAAFAFRALGRALKFKSDYHVVVLTSTVLPGSTRYGLIPILEKESGKRCGPDFGACYGPEFIALGSVIRDFLNPDFYLIGEYDQRSGDLLQDVNSRVSANQARCRRMSLENAELAKIALNSYVTIKISFANMVAELCEQLPGGNIDRVSDALGLDKRIGRKCLTGGLGFGGPCFPRDNVALAFVGRELGVECELLRLNDQYNRQLAARQVSKLLRWLKPGSTVAVLGLAYKPFSNVVEESQGLFLAKAFAAAGMRVIAYDPLALQQAQVSLQHKALVTESLWDCLAQAETVVVANPDEAFTSLHAEDFLKKGMDVTVIDCWRCLESKLSGVRGIRYVPLGRSFNDEANARRLKELWEGEDSLDPLGNIGEIRNLPQP